MTVPHIFATHAAGNVPASYLDEDFASLTSMAALNYIDVSQATPPVIGDGTADDTAAWQAILDAVPNGTIILVPDPTFIMKITSTLTMSDKEDVWITSQLDGRNFATSPVFIWDGANNGTILALDRCRSCHVEGFQWRTTNGKTVDTFIDIDGYSSGHISTADVVRYNSFNATNQLNSAAKLVSISATVSNNCENMQVCDNTFGVSSDLRPAAGGIGIYQGPNPNAKHNLFYRNGISQGTVGISIGSGSCDIQHLGGGQNETDVLIAASTEPILIANIETEASTVCIDFASAGGVLSIENCRFENQAQTSTGGFLKLDGVVTIFGCEFQAVPPMGGTAIESQGSGNLRLTIHDNKFFAGTTYALSGLDFFAGLVGTDTAQGLVAWHNSGISGLPSRYFFEYSGTDPITADPTGFFFGSPIRLGPRTLAQIIGGGIIPTEGTVAAITDSMTDVWGATITGGGALNVIGWFNGANWTVVAK